MSGTSSNIPEPKASSVNKSLLFSKVAGYFGLVIGVIVVVGWYEHWTVAIQVLPNLVAMKYNAALGFILCGTGLILLTTPRAGLAAWVGGIVALLGTLTVVEYVTNRSFGIDQLFLNDYIVTSTTFPGRMSPLTASCFIFIGLALVLTVRAKRSKACLMAIGMLTCIVAMIVCMALFGYISGIEVAYGWGAYTRMALHTAVTFLILSMGLLIWAWHSAERINFDFVRWLPVTGSMTLMVMIAVISIVSFGQLESSTSLRQHSYDVLVTAQTFLGDLLNTQRGLRGYALTGQPITLATYQSGVTDAPRQLAQLEALTRDNPAQEERAKTLVADLNDVIAYSHKLIDARNAQGIQAVIQIEATGEGFAVVNRMVADLNAFTDAEHALLAERSARADTDFQNTTRLLVFGRGLLVALLLLAYLMVSRELRLRHRAESKLQKNVSLQRVILNSTNYAIVSTDIHGVVTSFNSTAEHWLGYSADEIIGKRTPALWQDAGEITARSKELSRELGRKIQPGFEVFTAKASQGKTDESEWTFIRKDGRRFPVWLSVTALTETNGNITGYLGVINDITERKKAEETLRISEERFSNAFEYAAIGMALVSIEGRWIKVNKSLCDLVGYSAEELSTKTFQDITYPEDLDMDLQHVRELLEGRIRSYTMEKRYFHKQGHVVWVLLGVSLVRDKQNKPLYFISQIEDITRTKEIMARQQELIQKAQAAERAKSEFLAIMSHEIRTPMNGVIGMTSILADTELNDIQRDCVNTIHTSGESLLAVINDILDYSKIESGRLQMESRSFNLHHCVEEVFDLFAAQIRIKKLEVAYLIASDIPTHLMGDVMRLRQVLVNLVGNAIKFTTEGEVVVNVECQNQSEAGCYLLFSITDTGIGISKESIDKLFQAFQQVDTSTTRRYGGSGLGLIISKRITEMMGGRMWVESELGQGSTFFFTAAMQASSEVDLEDPANDPKLLKSHSALIVDDNATNRHILEIQLKRWGMVPTSTSSGREALKKLTQQSFDVALLDFQMPEMDGVTLAREIRKQTPIPLILLSSSGETVVGEDANLFRFQIPKPIKHSHLLKALLKVTGVADQQAQKNPEKKLDSGLAARHPLRILLAEDNTVNQKVGMLMLSRFGYTADLAANGRRAVDAIGKATYDLILMDIQMPEMNGVEATAIIRQKLGSKAPLIFALTAEALEGDRERFLSLGFDGYLSKPLQAHTLQDVLKTIKPRV